MPKKTTTRKPKTPAPTDPVTNGIVNVKEFDAFSQWIALPKRKREPATYKEMAALLDVHPDTLTDWKKREDFWIKVHQYRSVWLQTQVPDILEAAVREAKGDSFNDRKLLLEMAGEYTPLTRTELTGKDGNPIELGIVGIVRQALEQKKQVIDAPEEGND